MPERNADVPPERRIEYRIGHQRGRHHHRRRRYFRRWRQCGARLEALAEPCGIWVSRAVHEQVRDKLAFGFEDMGEREVKDMPGRSMPTEALRRPVCWLTPLPPPFSRPSKSAAGAATPPPVALDRPRPAIAVVVPPPAPWFMLKRGSECWRNVASAGRTSIAVLPFNNMSGDPSQVISATG